MYVSRNNETGLCNHCCSGKAISITYSENVFVAAGISMQCACAKLSSAWLASIFPHYIINGTIFEKKKLLNTKCVF
jgi:hypothetical protein